MPNSWSSLLTDGRWRPLIVFVIAPAIFYTYALSTISDKEWKMIETVASSIGWMPFVGLLVFISGIVIYLKIVTLSKEEHHVPTEE